VIEVIVPDSSTQLLNSKMTRIAKAIKKHNKQTTILVTQQNVETAYI